MEPKSYWMTPRCDAATISIWAWNPGQSNIKSIEINRNLRIFKTYATSGDSRKGFCEDSFRCLFCEILTLTSWQKKQHLSSVHKIMLWCEVDRFNLDIQTIHIHPYIYIYILYLNNATYEYDFQIFDIQTIPLRVLHRSQNHGRGSPVASTSGSADTLPVESPEVAGWNLVYWFTSWKKLALSLPNTWYLLRRCFRYVFWGAKYLLKNQGVWKPIVVGWNRWK